MPHFDFKAAGVRFTGDAAFPFAVFVRSIGETRPRRCEREHFDSWAVTTSARHHFERYCGIYGRSYVYCVNVVERKIVALGVDGVPLYDFIDPRHTYDNREPA